MTHPPSAKRWGMLSLALLLSSTAVLAVNPSVSDDDVDEARVQAVKRQKKALEAAGLLPAQVAPPTNELLVFYKPGNENAASRMGLPTVRRLKSSSRAHVVRAADPAAAEAALARLKADPGVEAVYFNRREANVRHAFTPNDPYFAKNAPASGWPGQWHLVNQHVAGRDSGVLGAWGRDLTGSGVTIGIVDDGIQSSHPDLTPNYVSADSFDFGQNDGDPSPVVAADVHGISVAGVAAARGGNGIGVTGAAPLAKIAGMRVDFDNQTTAMFVDGTLYHSSGLNTTVKVKNHSYGPSAAYADRAAETAALNTSAASGTIHVFSAGNERGYEAEDSNTMGLPAAPAAITVAALGSDGKFADYSNYGACVTVTAPSSSFNAGAFGVTTTDRLGTGFGYNDDQYDAFPDADYTSEFGGTSSAAPLVAGIMALAKQAQPSLNVRFAKHLLARTSTQVDPTDVTDTSGGGWTTNSAGIKFNQNYGFGMINADALTEAAASYTGVTTLSTTGTSLTAVGATIPDNSTTGISRNFNITSTTPLEEVLINLTVTHNYRGDVEAYLTAPSGTVSRLVRRNTEDNANNIAWTFCSNQFWGENPAGMWTLKLIDTGGGDVGTWVNYQATLRQGQLISDPDLTVISPNGGENWLEGTVHPITWNSAAAGDNVAIEYSTNNGGAWNTIIASTANDGSFDWTVPGTATTQARVRVTSTSVALSDGSNAAFTITGNPGDQYEADNSLETAKTIGDGETQNHTVHLIGDVDWATFTLTTKRRVNLETGGPAGGDTVLTLYRADGSVLVVNDDIKKRKNLYSRIKNKRLAPGTYYVKVEEKGNDTTLAAYTLKLSTKK